MSTDLMAVVDASLAELEDSRPPGSFHEDRTEIDLDLSGALDAVLVALPNISIKSLPSEPATKAREPLPRFTSSLVDDAFTLDPAWEAKEVEQHEEDLVELDDDDFELIDCVPIVRGMPIECEDTKPVDPSWSDEPSAVIRTGPSRVLVALLGLTAAAAGAYLFFL